MSEKLVPTAKVVDGILILSLPDALCPVVWQMEVGQSKSSALEVRPDETDGSFGLILKTPRQDVLDVAKYATREGAVRALMTVSAAMEKAQGQIRQAQNLPYGARSSEYNYAVPALRPEPEFSFAKSFLKKFFVYLATALGAVLIVAVAFFLLYSLVSGLTTADGGSSSAQNAPVSAEDFLEGR